MTNGRAESSSGRAAHKLELTLMEPTFIAAIGYIDLGDLATNIQAGTSFGYRLLRVVVWANLMAVLIQVLSTELGIVTGENLAEQIRDHYPRPVMWFYWMQAEIIAMATDLAEFIGAMIGFKLILGVSLLQGVVLTGIAIFLILVLQRREQKPLEKVIGGLLLPVAAAYVVELILSQPNFAWLSKGVVIPSLSNSEAVFLVAGVLGATIMPHVIYLHSSLTQHLCGGTRQQRYTATKQDVATAMTIAGFVSLATMAMAAVAFHFSGYIDIAGLGQAYLTLEPLLNRAMTMAFSLSLVAAGLSSIAVGTLAKQVAMQGFTRFHIPSRVRRIVTMMPSFIVILMGLDPTRTLMMNQVLLGSGIALALVSLLIFTSDGKLMDDLMDTRWVEQIGQMIVVLVVAPNVWLLVGAVLDLQKQKGPLTFLLHQ